MYAYEILLVDDDHIILETVGCELAKRGYKITTAANGDEAISLLHARPFNLVLTDLKMGRTGGIEVLKEAKRLNPETMVIILTGHADITSAIDALRLKAEDYIIKPCDFAEIYFRVSRCFEKLAVQQKIKIYEKILPVCCSCKKIRDDEGKKRGMGEWMSVETYISTKAKLDITSTYCPECAQELSVEIQKKISGHND